MNDPTDNLSPAARTILGRDASAAYERLTVPDGQPGNARARALLESLAQEQTVVGTISSIDDARAIVGALWLWHDWLDESHKISQKIETPTGSWWHAIMHRREGDFSNSKHWYARCAMHSLMSAMGPQAAGVVNPMPSDKMLLRMTRAGWDPAVFVDVVEQVHDKPDDPRHKAMVRLQQLEWRLLFDHCVRAAAGK